MGERYYATEECQAFDLAGEEGGGGALLIHGFMGTPKEMRPLAGALVGAGVAARGVLLPGFGADMGRLANVRVGDWVGTAAEAWGEALARHERTTLIGFSMGAAVALHLAAQRPPTRLVLLAPHWRFADRRALALPVVKRVVKTLRPFANADFAQPGVRQAFAEMSPDLDLDDPATQARLRRETTLPTATLDELRRVSAASARLARRVTAPTLLLQGRGDETVTPASTRRLALRLGGPISLHELPAGHLLVADDGPAWARVRDLVVGFATGDEA